MAFKKHIHPAEQPPELAATSPLSVSAGSAKEMQKADPFYLGVEWLACWMLDNVEGEIVSEEKLREWAGRAWARHILSQNAKALSS